MKIKITKEDLVLGISKVQNVVSSKATLPILANMLLETKKNSCLRIYATDLDIGISCEIPVQIFEEGAITVPAKKFSDIIKELPPGDISITTKKNHQIEIEGENCQFKLIGLPKEDFPKFPEFKNTEVLPLNQGILKQMLQTTAFAVSHEEARYILNGVLFEISDNIIRLVATDGRRLAKSEEQLDTPIKKDIHLIIPTKAVHEIIRNLKDGGGVSLLISTNQVLFDIDNVLVVTRIIEGEFPNYNQVIPPEQKTKIKINTQDFLYAIRRANLLATPDFQAVKFEVFKNKLVVSKITPDVGESREEVEIVYGGAEMIVGFNPGFFIEVLKNINEEEIELELLGPDKPGVIRLKNYLYLALPMRI
ncbi:MAG: DNA polymerase III subunit beta [Candidatus Aceula meridiana]|nr:DNA polymerase III subunit beta [Candidatus Aceula meridiana]